MIFRIIFATLVWTVFWSCKSSTEVENSPHEHSDTLNRDSLVVPIFFDSSYYKWEGDHVVIQWDDLLDVTFERLPHALLDTADIPRFSKKVEALNGKNVIVEGYYIPVEETGDEKIVILSAFPYVQCFFCGQAGVESIIDVLISEKLPRIKTDTKVKFRGRFKTNATNFDYLIYILEEAEYVPEPK